MDPFDLDVEPSENVGRRGSLSAVHWDALLLNITSATCLAHHCVVIICVEYGESIRVLLRNSTRQSDLTRVPWSAALPSVDPLRVDRSSGKRMGSIQKEGVQHQKSESDNCFGHSRHIRIPPSGLFE